MSHSNVSRREVIRVLAGLGIAAGIGDAVARDAAKVDPRGYRVVLENDQVRVLEYIGKPRLGVCGEGMHSHPDHVTVLMTPIRARVTLPEGKTFVAENKAGDVIFEAAGTHAVENIGGRESRALLIELKSQAAKR